MSSPKMPNPPDYAAANEAAIYADISTLEIRKKIEAAAAKGGSVTYTDPETGESKTANFQGFGDLDQARDMLPFIGESARAVAEAQLGIAEEFGGRFIEQRLQELEQSDPIGFELRQKLGEAVRADLDAGFGLGDGLRSEIQQGIRGGQVARGNLFGAAPVAAEAFGVGEAALRLRQQRLGNVASFLSGTTPVAQFSQINGAQGGAASFNPLGVGQGVGLNPNAGAQGAQFAMQSYQQQSQNAVNSAQLSPLNTLLGFGGAMVGVGVAGGVGNLFSATPGVFSQGVGKALGGTASPLGVGGG